MNLVEKEIKINDQIFVLTNQRALFWKQASALILSDLHLGKTAHFRKNGIALPANLIQEDLKRLSKLILHFKAEQIIIVGDFLHAGKNSEFELFKQWKAQFPTLKIILVKGNHDRISNQNLLDLGVSEVHHLYEKGGLIFSHEEIKNSESFVISGHRHPGVILKSATKNLKFPCFIVSEKQLILPAFSSFTGLNTNNSLPNSKKYIFDKDHIFLIE